jgi:lactose/L-arabinose transport system ATP-binding protein
MAQLSLSGIKKGFGSVQVIKGVDLEIADKEFVVFVGPSGCGKSTLLRLVAGLEDIDEGTLHIGGKDVTDAEPVDRGIAMVFQTYALYPHMTVEENMGFGLKVSGLPKDEVKKRVDEAAKSLQLTHLLDRKPKAMSGGQRQRVAIGRAIVRNPQVFLFDEPLSNLDAELRVHMRIELARLHQKLGATMIYVTHDQVEAMTLADKIVVLSAGRIEQVGAPLQLYDDPNNLFVAGFIGSPKMNFIKGKVQAQNGKFTTIALLGDGKHNIDMPLKSSLTAGTEVTLGIRPEHFGDAKGKGTRFDLKADVTEDLGEITYVHTYTSDGTHIVVEKRGDRSIQEGATVSVTLPAEKAFVFDQSGQRLR